MGGYVRDIAVASSNSVFAIIKILKLILLFNRQPLGIEQKNVDFFLSVKEVLAQPKQKTKKQSTPNI